MPNVGGIGLGIGLFSPQKRLAFSIRNDILLALGRPSWVIATGQSSQNLLEDDFQIMQFWRQNYVEASYNMLKHVGAKRLSVHLGYGYINGGKRQTVSGLTRHGYSVATAALSYMPDGRFGAELRGDMPLSGGVANKLWALSMCLFYSF